MDKVSKLAGRDGARRRGHDTSSFNEGFSERQGDSLRVVELDSSSSGVSEGFGGVFSEQTIVS